MNVLNESAGLSASATSGADATHNPAPAPDLGAAFSEIAGAALTARDLLHDAVAQGGSAALEHSVLHIVAWIGHLADRGSVLAGSRGSVCGSIDEWMKFSALPPFNDDARGAR